MKSVLKCALLAAASCMPDIASAGAEMASDTFYTTDELRRLSLDALAELDVVVTTASKKAEKLFDAPTAVFVITQDAIRRSGVTTIPEALRLAPGVQVARIDANSWAITARGFNGRFANKLLVLIDGRTVYSPLFSGVFWNSQDYLLEDIDRIEVIRGPGATIWGANAVNGVINIITKTAEQTQDGLLSAGVGTEELGFVGLRYGGKWNEDAHYRAYGKFFARDNSVDAFGDEAADSWHMGQGGFRVDWDIALVDSLTVQGDYYTGEVGDTDDRIPSLTPPFSVVRDETGDLSGGNVLARWQHSISDDNDLTLQFYFDRVQRKILDFNARYNTIDLDFAHRFFWGQDQELIWGLGYRLINDDITSSPLVTPNSFPVSYNPQSRNTQLFSGFVQNSFALPIDDLRLIVGTKLEHNDFTGFEIQPTARLLWQPNDQHMLWAAVSRAVRTPLRSSNVRINVDVIAGEPPTLISIFGNPNALSEQLIAYESGYRMQAGDRFFFDFSAFYNDYNTLRTLEPGALRAERFPPPTHALIPLIEDNKLEGETYGIEIAANFRPLDRWNVNLAYSYLQMRMHRKSGSRDLAAERIEGESPHHQLSVLSALNITSSLEWDLWLRYVDRLPAQNVAAYFTFDTRLAWTPHDHLELSIVGQNLLDSRRVEFIAEILDLAPVAVERGVYGKLVWRF